ncbi:MAG: NAD(P)/FAD-dependent oxidoreductase [Candidatus Micrarchaeaceae archaeon]
MSEEYDLIIAGGGMAGLAAALTASKLGIKAILLDRNKIDEIGKKTNWGWVCGDAVAKAHLDFVKAHTGTTFSEPEIDKNLNKIYALSPDLESKFPFEGEGAILNRPLFEQKLLQIALKNGIEYEPEFEVEGPIINENAVKGIYGKNKAKKDVQILGKITIDALGIATTIRRKLPENPYIERNIDIDDIEATGRYIYTFKINHEDKRFYDPDNALIHLNQQIAPGGYGWVFPKKNNKINIGLGVQKTSLELRNKKMNKNSTLQQLLDEYVKSNPVFKDLQLFNEFENGKGFWSVGVRRQIESLAFNGYLGAGDSMMMPNPVSAGGIGPALSAGILAAECANDSLNKKEFNLNTLWDYNIRFNEVYGNKTGGLEVFRIYLQSLNNDELNYGMKNFVTLEEAEALAYGKPIKLSMANKVKLIIKGAQNIRAFSNLIFAVREISKMNEIYSRYPKDPAKFENWKKEVKSEIEKVKSKLKPNPI